MSGKITAEGFKTPTGDGTRVLKDDGTTVKLVGSIPLVLPVVKAMAAGDLCRLVSDGKMWKSDARFETSTAGLLMFAKNAIEANSTGEFVDSGIITISTIVLTVGSTYYVSRNIGEITSVKPTEPGSIIRAVGHAVSTTELYIRISETYIEVI